MAGSVNNNNYFSQVNARFQTELTKGDGATAQNLRNQSGVTHTAKKTTVKKGGNVAEEGASLSDAARQQLKTEQQHHADHVAEHGHELAQQTGIETDHDDAEDYELQSKRGYERTQEELQDGPTPDGRVKLTSPEGKVQLLKVEDHSHLQKMDDPDITDQRLLDDIPEANLNAANATLDTQMANGVSKVAVLKTDPKIDAVAESMEVQPLPALAEPMDIAGPGNDKTSLPMVLDFPPEMERVAAEKAARELASGELQQEMLLSGPGMTTVATPPAASPPVIETQAASAQTVTPEQATRLSTAVEALAATPASAWPELAKTMGVEANTGLGAAPQGESREAEAQRNQWRAGQALTLAQAGEFEWAREVLNGGHSHLVGKPALEGLRHDKAATQQFHGHYLDQRPKAKILELNDRISELGGQQVAVLHRDPASGQLREFRGTVEGTSPGKATFRLKEHPDLELNQNYQPGMALLSGEIPSMPPVEMKSPGPNRDYPPLGRTDALLAGARELGTRQALQLLEQAGVKPHQASGEEFKAGLQGDAAQEQVKQWRLGQAAALYADRDHLGAKQVLSGKHDNLAGKELGPILEQNRELNIDFQRHYASHGGQLHNSPSRYQGASAEDMAGKYVALLHPDPETGVLKEYRGHVKPVPGGDALFEIASLPGQVLNTNYLTQLAVLPGTNVPPMLAPQAPPEKPAASGPNHTTLLSGQSTVDDLQQFVSPLQRLQRGEARSGLNPEQRQDLEQLEADVKAIRGMQRQISERPGDSAFANAAGQQMDQARGRIRELAMKHQSRESNFNVMVNPDGEVYTSLRWKKDQVSPEMRAEGYQAVNYTLISSPGRDDFELQSTPLGANGQPDGNFAKVRVGTGDPNKWEGVAATVGNPSGENGFHASTVTPGDPRLRIHGETDTSRLSTAQKALAEQTMADSGLKWPTGQTTTAENGFQNRVGEQQEPVKPGFLNRLRYLFTGDPSHVGGTPPYSPPPPQWYPPHPPVYDYFGGFPSYQYPPTQFGGHPGFVPGWGGGGMDTFTKIMMATSMISSVAMPMMFFANTMFW